MNLGVIAYRIGGWLILKTAVWASRPLSLRGEPTRSRRQR